jgi:hypothetical protein
LVLAANFNLLPAEMPLKHLHFRCTARAGMSKNFGWDIFLKVVLLEHLP